LDPKKGMLIARLGIDIAVGDRTDAVATAKELPLHGRRPDPVDELKEFLTERDRRHG